VQGEVNGIAMRGELKTVFNLEGYLRTQVVPEVLAYAGQMNDRWDPKLPQMVFGADTGEHKQVGRSDCTGAQYDAVRFDMEHLSTAVGYHAGGPPILDDNLPDEDSASHCQVQMVAHGTEMRHGSTHSHAIQVIRGRHAKSAGVQAIGIVGRAKPRLDAESVECLLDDRPRARLTTPDRHRTPVA
jgi:hypothetical protein